MMAEFCSIPKCGKQITLDPPERSIIRALRDSYEPAFKEKMVCSLYLRARGHNCLSQSMVNVNLTHIQAVHTDLLSEEWTAASVQNDVYVQQLTRIMDDLMKESAAQSRTRKLWVEYL